MYNFNQLLRRLMINNHNLLSDIVLLSKLFYKVEVRHIKRMVTELLNCVRILFCVNPVESSQATMMCLDTVLANFVNGAGNYNEVTNFLLLLMEIETSKSYVHNVFMEDTPPVAQ
jgi:hypothetical protein